MSRSFFVSSAIYIKFLITTLKGLDNKTYGFVSELTELQQDILQILDVPAECYTYEYLFDTS